MAVLVGLAAGERTVVVTPRPRWYQPAKFAQEPRRDPASPHVPPLMPLRRPVISLRVLHNSPNSLLSSTLPVEHRQQEVRGSLSERPIVVMASAPTSIPANHKPDPPASFQLEPAPFQTEPPAPSRLQEQVFVESLPSLSVQLDNEVPPRETAGLPDYLTPPKYPSVYESHFTDGKQNNVPQLAKKKKKNKKRKQKIDSREKDRNRGAHPHDKLHPFRTQNSGERVEFQLHGQNGPDSYKFGFDTGAGKNRQFRFEEKDSQGNVVGHFGYYDTTGKLQVFNYRADETGFHAEQVD